MGKEYFTTWFRLDQLDRYLICINTEPETVLLGEDSLIVVFRSEVSLAKYVQAKGIEIVNEQPLLHDLDAVIEWTHQPASPISCQECLAAWNFFSDAAHSVNRAFSGDKKGKLRNSIYDMLFYGNNIYGLTPNGEFYIPQWTEGERRRLAAVLMEGLSIFRNQFKEIKE